MNWKSLLPILFFALSIPRPSFAGLNQAPGDKASQTCGDSHKLELATLQTAMASILGRINTLDAKINAATHLLQQIESELALNQATSEILTKLATSFDELEEQAGVVSQVIKTLKQEMESQKDDSKNLESWRESLARLIPVLKTKDRPTAQMLLKQMDFAAMTTNAELTSQVIKLLEMIQAEELPTQTESLWIGLQEKRTARINELQSEKANLINFIGTGNSEKKSESTNRDQLQNHVNNVNARGC
jgi:chromosome segregation ATPase